MGYIPPLYIGQISVFMARFQKDFSFDGNMEKNITNYNLYSPPISIHDHLSDFEDKEFLARREIENLKTPPLNYLDIPENTEDSLVRIANEIVLKNEQIDSCASKNVLRWLNGTLPSTEKPESSKRGRDGEDIMSAKRLCSTYYAWNSDAYSDVTDPPDAVESRPSSSLMSETDFVNNFSYNTVDIGEMKPSRAQQNHKRPTSSVYFVSLPDTHSWSISANDSPNDNTHSISVSPTLQSCPTAGITDCQINSEESLYDDPQKLWNHPSTNLVISGGRITPPPPYRPPATRRVNNELILFDNCDNYTVSQDIQMDLSTNHTELMGRLTPPPPYQSTTKTPTLGKTQTSTNLITSPTSSVYIGKNSSPVSPTQHLRETPTPLTAKPTPATVPWDVSMPTPPADDQAHAGEEASYLPMKNSNVTGMNSDEDDDKKVFVPAGKCLHLKIYLCEVFSSHKSFPHNAKAYALSVVWKKL